MSAADVRRSLSVNVVANAVGRTWQAVLQIIVTPITLQLLGAESYGVVGFSSAILGTLAFLDSATSPVLARELNPAARQAADPVKLRNMLFSLQAIAFATAFVVAFGLAAGAPWVARYWLTASSLSETWLKWSIVLIALGIAAQWPSMLYGSAFVAHERQDLLALIRIIAVTLQSLGGIALLYLVARDILTYLAWLAWISLAASVAMGVTLWRIMPPAAHASRFDSSLLWTHRRFILGNLIIGLQAALLTQADKLIVARFATLDALAAYSLASMVAFTLNSLAAVPILGSLMPRFAALAAGADRASLAEAVHRFSQIVALSLLPTAATLAMFAEPALRLWLGQDSPLVLPVSELLPWVLAGVCMNALMGVPHLVQLGHGWTGLAIRTNAIATPVFVLASWWGIPVYGSVFGAWAFMALNAVYILVQAPLVFRRLMPGNSLRWLMADIATPAAVSVSTVVLLRRLVPPGLTPVAAVACAFLVGAVTLVATFAVLPHARRSLLQLSRRLYQRLR